MPDLLKFKTSKKILIYAMLNLNQLSLTFLPFVSSLASFCFVNFQFLSNCCIEVLFIDSQI